MARIDFVTGNAQRYLPDVEALADVPDRFERLVATRSDAELRREPADGGWSAARIAGHMIAYARASRERLHRMIWMTDPVFAPMSDAAEAEREGWQAWDGPRLAQAFAEALGETVAELADLPDAGWGRAGISPRAGRRSIHQQAQEAVAHYREHLEQLERVLGAPRT